MDKLFVESGSHVLANTQWGCTGVHKSWLISDFNNKEEALEIIPPFLRHSANIVELVTFTKEDILQPANRQKNKFLLFDRKQNTLLHS